MPQSSQPGTANDPSVRAEYRRPSNVDEAPLAHRVAKLDVASESVSAMAQYADQSSSLSPNPLSPSGEVEVVSSLGADRLVAFFDDVHSIAQSLSRIADPPPADIVGTPYVAKRLACTTVWVAEMIRNGGIPKECVVEGTGNGKPWKFHRQLIDEWIKTR
jgi:hypothetical protein